MTPQGKERQSVSIAESKKWQETVKNDDDDVRKRDDSKKENEREWERERER